MKFWWLLYLFVPSLLACERSLSIGADLDWPPYSYKEGNLARGIDIEIARQVFESAGYCVTFVDMPSANRAIEELKSGKVGVLLAASYSQLRAAQALFSDPYRNETVSLFSHSKSNMQGDSIQTLFTKGATFAVNTGSYVGPDFTRLAENHRDQIIYLSSVEQRLVMLNSGRIDFVVEDDNAGAYISDKNALNNIFLTTHQVYQNPVHFMLSKVHFTEQQAQAINKLISPLD